MVEPLQPAKVRVSLLGEMSVHLGLDRVDDAMGARGRELLAYLVIFPDRDHPRERLMTVLWPDKDLERSSASLRRALFLLRRALGDAADQVLKVSDSAIGLRREAVESDLYDLLWALERGGDAVDSAVAEYAAAHELLGGAAAPEWSLPECDGLRRRVVDAGRTRLADLVAEGRGGAKGLLALSESVLRLEPLDEDAHAVAIRSRAWLGDRAGAADQYRRCADILSKELGVSPAPQVEAALAEALSGPQVNEAYFPPAVHGDQPQAPDFPPVEIEVAVTGQPEGPVADMRRSQVPVRRVVPLLSPVAVIVAFVLVIAMAGTGLWAIQHRVNAAARTTEELINEHRVASYMEMMPVASSQPSEVDAWFRQHVNYPVRSAAATGLFTLYGGGLCDLAGRLAATAVYRSPENERVTVFKFPAGDLVMPIAPELDGATALRGLSHRGHSLVFWEVDGVVHALVSEIDLSSLTELAGNLNDT